MKELIKKGLEKFGIRLNFSKNLWYLEPYVLMQRFIAKDDPVIFDIGACDGHTSKIFKNIFPKARIYAFEPYPDSFKLLENTAKEVQGVSAHPYALSDNNGTMDFFVNKSKATNSLLPAKNTDSFIDEHVIYEKKISVETQTLDNFVEANNINNADILKLDVQGGELLVFEGAKNFLQQKKAKLIYAEIWFIEGYTGQPLYHDIASHLAKFGYLPFGIYNMHFRKDGHFLWGDAIFYHRDNKLK